MNLKEQRAAAFKAAKEALEAGDFDLAESKSAEVEELDAKITKATKGSALLERLGNLGEGGEGDAREKGLEAAAAATLGDHFAKSIYAEVKANVGTSGFTAKTPEWEGPSVKAATDTQVTGTTFNTPVLTTFDRTIVQQVRPELVLTDLLGTGTISGTAISYFVEQGSIEGGFTTVAEGAAKPQVHFPDPTTRSDSVKKIAGFIKFTDEMLEDLGFVVSEINTRLLYELAKFEENQLFNGDGTGTNILGLLNRSGIQLMARAGGVAANPADDESVADVLFRAATAVRTGADLEPDGIAMHPLDYQELRLSKDANGQYFGGGYFAGQYGNGSIMQNPPVWGLRTIVTPSIAQGTAVVGAFRQSATVYRKGGIRVESTNSHSDDFTNNKVTVRAEERIALAVRKPAGIVKVDLSTPA